MSGRTTAPCAQAAAGHGPPTRLARTRARADPDEARKLALALGLGQHSWCLVLDEPTNHLDLPSLERLEAAHAFAAHVTVETWPCQMK